MCGHGIVASRVRARASAARLVSCSGRTRDGDSWRATMRAREQSSRAVRWMTIACGRSSRPPGDAHRVLWRARPRTASPTACCAGQQVAHWCSSTYRRTATPGHRCGRAATMYMYIPVRGPVYPVRLSFFEHLVWSVTFVGAPSSSAYLSFCYKVGMSSSPLLPGRSLALFPAYLPGGRSLHRTRHTGRFGLSYPGYRALTVAACARTRAVLFLIETLLSNPVGLNPANSRN